MMISGISVGLFVAIFGAAVATALILKSEWVKAVIISFLIPIGILTARNGFEIYKIQRNFRRNSKWAVKI